MVEAPVPCIVCIEPKPESAMSDEHVFPEAVGGTFVIRRVCRRCNGQLGHEIDHHLANDWFVFKERVRLGLAGKTGKIRSPVPETRFDDGTRVRLIASPDSDKIRPVIIPSYSEDADGTLRFSVDPTEIESLPGFINRTLTQRGRRPLSDVEIALRLNVTHEESVTAQVHTTSDVALLQRAFLKIAYEMAWHWLGDTYLEDAEGKEIRRLLQEREPPEVWQQGGYDLMGRLERIEGTDGRLWYESQKPDWLVASLEVHDGALKCYVRVLSAYQGWFRVSRTPDQYSLNRKRYLLIDPKRQFENEI